MSKKLIGYSLVLLMLTSATTYFIGWNKGNAVGYKEATADVFLGLLNPAEYFKSLLAKRKKK